MCMCVHRCEKAHKCTRTYPAPPTKEACMYKQTHKCTRTYPASISSTKWSRLRTLVPLHSCTWWKCTCILASVWWFHELDCYILYMCIYIHITIVTLGPVAFLHLMRMHVHTCISMMISWARLLYFIYVYIHTYIIANLGPVAFLHLVKMHVHTCISMLVWMSLTVN
jgi:hypothetical protein